MAAQQNCSTTNLSCSSPPSSFSRHCPRYAGGAQPSPLLALPSMSTSYQGSTLADLKWGLSSIQEARFALAAMYGLQIYEWFDWCVLPLTQWSFSSSSFSIGKEIKLVRVDPMPLCRRDERFLDTPRTLELCQNLVPPLPILPPPVLAGHHVGVRGRPFVNDVCKSWETCPHPPIPICE